MTMADKHDFKEFPELTNRQLEEHRFESPHKQITESFEATVVKVHDGDTITLVAEFRDFRFPLRFLGIDAPEMNDGGETAQEWLSERILGDIVQIIINTKNRVDKFGRLLGAVFVSGINVGDEMIRLGLAVQFSKRRQDKLPNLDEYLSVKQWF